MLARRGSGQPRTGSFALRRHSTPDVHDAPPATLSRPPCAGVNPTRRQAIGSLLLYRREVSESTLVRFQRLQGDDEADVYSMSPRKRSRHLAQNKERSAQRRGQRRSWCGVPIFADRSLFVQVRAAPVPARPAQERTPAMVAVQPHAVPGSDAAAVCAARCAVC